MISRFEWLVILFCLCILQVLCFWGIDISVSAMISSPDAILTNGLNIQTPLTIYHLCLYISILASIGIVIISVHLVEKLTKTKPDEN